VVEKLIKLYTRVYNPAPTFQVGFQVRVLTAMSLEVMNTLGNAISESRILNVWERRERTACGRASVPES
jgi:hypothetical protein